jgi:hypothetical protein
VDITWTPQNDNNAERRESVQSQANTFQCEWPHAREWDGLTYKLVQCGTSIDAKFPEDGLVRPKHAAIECDFNGK